MNEKEWIDCENQSPQLKQPVLVHAKGGRMLTAIYTHLSQGLGYYCYDISSEDFEIVEYPTHWMQLPGLPK